MTNLQNYEDELTKKVDDLDTLNDFQDVSLDSAVASPSKVAPQAPRNNLPSTQEQKTPSIPNVPQPKTIKLKKAPIFSWKSFCNYRFLNLILLAIVFFCIFSGYNIAQNFSTSVHGGVGAISLGIVYFFFAISNLYAPAVIDILGPKWSIFFSTIPYCVFVLLSAIPTPEPENGVLVDFFTRIFDWQFLSWGFFLSYASVLAFLVSSAWLGSVAGILWTSEAVYVTNISYDRSRNIREIGLFTGVFFAIFGFNMILGNMLVLVLLFANINIYLIFVVMFIVTVAGNVLSLFLYPYGHVDEEILQKKVETELPVVKKESNENGRVSEEETKEAKHNKFRNLPKKLWRKFIRILRDIRISLISTFFVFIDVRMLLLAPLCLYAGFTNTFFYGTLSEKTAYAPWIAIAFICFGVAECLGSIIIGKGNDVLGRRPMLYVTLFLHALAIIVSFEPIFLLSGRARIDNSSGEGTIITEGWPITIFLSFILWGLADSAFFTTVISIIPTPRMFAKNPSPAFAAFNFFHAIATSIMFIVSIFLHELFFVYHLFLVVMWCFAAVCAITLDCFVARFDARTVKIKRKREKKDNTTVITKNPRSVDL